MKGWLLNMVGGRFVCQIGAVFLIWFRLAEAAVADGAEAAVIAADAILQSESVQAARKIFEAVCDFPDLEGIEQARLGEQASLAERDEGLRLTAGYRFREGAISGIRHRGDLTLEWDVLDDGWLEQRWKARGFRQRQMLAALQAPERRARRLLACREDRLRTLFISLERRLLNQALPWMQRFIAALRERYYQGRILYDDVLRWEALARRLEQRAQDYRSFPAADARLPPLYSLDWQAVTAGLTAPPLSPQEELLRLKYPWFDDIRLTVFAGGGFRGTEEIRPTLTTGMRVSVPLRFPLTQPVPEGERRKLRALWEEHRRRLRLQLRELFEQYQRKLGDAIDLAARQEMLKERLRRDRLLSAVAVRDDLVRLQHVVEYLEAARQSLAIRRSLYQRLLRLASLRGIQEFPRDWVRPVSLARFQRRLGERAIYLWNRGLEHSTPDRIFDFMEAKGIGRLLVSGSARIAPVTRRRLHQLAAQRGVKLEWILGGPDWLAPKYQDRIVSRIRQLQIPEDNATLNLHLDIEPHLLPDFDAKRGHYQELWLVLLDRLRREFPNFRWSVALPLRYEPDFFFRLAERVDRIYLMAYGFDIDYLIRRLARFRPLLESGRLAVALRLSDFADEAALERYVARLYQEAGCRAFALHHFRAALEVLGR